MISNYLEPIFLSLPLLTSLMKEFHLTTAGPSIWGKIRGRSRWISDSSDCTEHQLLSNQLSNWGWYMSVKETHLLFQVHWIHWDKLWPCEPLKHWVSIQVLGWGTLRLHGHTVSSDLSQSTAAACCGGIYATPTLEHSLWGVLSESSRANHAPYPLKPKLWPPPLWVCWRKQRALCTPQSLECIQHCHDLTCLFQAALIAVTIYAKAV